MKKSIWIFLLAVLLPSAVLGWLALRSAEEQQIVFERRTAELYQKETEALAVTIRESVESERREFGETVHRLLAKGDAAALARDFSNTLADAWAQKAIGFALDEDGKLVSPTAQSAVRNPAWGKFLMDNGSFICSSEPAMVYAVSNENPARAAGGYARSKISGAPGWQAARAGESKFKIEMDAAPAPTANAPAQPAAGAVPQPTPVVAPGTAQSYSAYSERAPQPAPLGDSATKSDAGGLQSKKSEVASSGGRGQNSMSRVAAADKPAADAEQLKKQIQPAVEPNLDGKNLRPDATDETARTATAPTGKLGAFRQANEAPSTLAAQPTRSRPVPSEPQAPAPPPAKSQKFGATAEYSDDRASAFKERSLLEHREEKQAYARLADAAKAMPGAPPAQPAGAGGKDESLQQKRDDQQKAAESEVMQEQAAKVMLNRNRIELESLKRKLKN